MIEVKENRFKKFAEAEVEEVPEVVEAVEEPKQTPKETRSSLVDKLKSDSSEKKKNYQFTLQPSQRKKLSKISEKLGIRSDSALLGEMIDNLYDEVFGE
ncbi:TPA: hypothetical protein IWM33_002371 [Enterococcus faecium]|nr:hypothetical protein [Enterococcus faecium]HAP6956889.1 hypothetical protein [Enterococcus faecium]HAP7045512.1 hypothetical protein [Enterococcus faecium]HAP7329278.1 hypothetical protein [Enterococcus faecium]HAP7395551.1 hypothetical protein [Enterococcus faecium]